jgi:hypothetical protein
MNANITTLQEKTATLETNLSSEITRATEAETGLSNRITDLEAKVGSEAAFATNADIQALFS